MRWFWLGCFSYCAAVSGAEPPQRIASYSPGATQTLLDLGSSAQIIATTRWCPLPKTHPAVRTCDAFNPDLETLLQAKPDLVILPRLANPLWAERCTRAGLKIIILQTEGPDSVTRDLELLGEATHQQVAAKALRARLDRPAASGPRTLLIVWDGMMAGPDAYTTPVLKQAGFKSPLQAGTWVKLDWELLVQANPDAILWIDSKPENTPISPSQSRQKELSQIIVVKELKSVKTSQIYATTSGSHWLPGSGLILASEKLTELSKVLK
jgi:ABC-type Fe3+-hydroxamate transport system substrate-binding protein